MQEPEVRFGNFPDESPVEPSAEPLPGVASDLSVDLAVGNAG